MRINTRVLAIGVVIACGLAGCEKPPPPPAAPTDSSEQNVAADRSLKDINLGISETALKLTVTPTFDTPLCVEVYIGATSSRLVVYRFSGAGGYDRGSVDLVFKRQLDFYDLETFRDHFQPKYDLWNEATEEPPDRENIGLDGNWYVLEIKDASRLHRIERWQPDYRTAERNLTMFKELIDWLISLGGIHPCKPFRLPDEDPPSIKP